MRIPGQYIVTFVTNSTTEKFDYEFAIEALEAPPIHRYDMGSFKGFAAVMNDSLSIRSSYLSIPQIQSIEQDATISVDTLKPIEAKISADQPLAPWNLARISHREPGSTDYIYADSAGEGTCVYVLDSGIFLAHPDFQGRAFHGTTLNPRDGNDLDMTGHGTLVAGIAGGAKYGVAKKTKLIAVKIFGEGLGPSFAQTVAGLQYVSSDAPSRGCGAGVVINMSFGTAGSSTALNEALSSAISQGFFVVAATGNTNADAGGVWPANVASVCTVSSSDQNDNKDPESNYGAVVDIWAPGMGITGPWIGGENMIITASGTSAAAPHIAGLGAYLLAQEGRRDPVALCQRMKDLGSRVVKGAPSGTTNVLAFNGAT
ncbi:alkaline protease-like protein [Aulographum hederae CBS 113979]|uniref:Alkaline protease-like protein n=1 Tax=Aulographum hederae CBS 113979 TaxID=1176131 RepID=A0A6G1HEZ9_9PEZI|nr:alkaline protease-like protein [Aulographum hederae CBS 113979]